MSRLYEVRRHRRAHAAQSDESSLHIFNSVVLSRQDLPGIAPRHTGDSVVQIDHLQAARNDQVFQNRSSVMASQPVTQP
jgi:hypothetical protein